jgi:membrane-associated phospholipid phosphatase
MNATDDANWRDELRRLDVSVYAAIAATPTPHLDRVFRLVSRAADHSKLWLFSAAVLAARDGPQGRRAAVDGVASVALTSAVVNVVLKPLGGRRRPDRELHDVPAARQVAMPRSTSFPSGHAASAFAFATGVAADLPAAGIPLSAAAAVVAYSRVHTGVHYPADVIAGSVAGGSIAPLSVALIRRWRAAINAGARPRPRPTRRRHRARRRSARRRSSRRSIA